MNLGPYIIESELKSGSISLGLALEIGKKLGVDFDQFDIEEFRRGIEVEFEHANTIKDVDDFGDDDIYETAAKIAIDHLKENPRYYTNLDSLDETYKDEWGRPSSAVRGYGYKWRKTRELVIKRDKYKCQNCGKKLRKKDRQVDHIVKRKSKSGHDGISNLRLLCGLCHRRKTAKCRIK